MGNNFIYNPEGQPRAPECYEGIMGEIFEFLDSTSEEVHRREKERQRKRFTVIQGGKDETDKQR